MLQRTRFLSETPRKTISQRARFGEPVSESTVSDRPPPSHSIHTQRIFFDISNTTTTFRQAHSITPRSAKLPPRPHAQRPMHRARPN